MFIGRRDGDEGRRECCTAPQRALVGEVGFDAGLLALGRTAPGRSKPISSYPARPPTSRDPAVSHPNKYDFESDWYCHLHERPMSWNGPAVPALQLLLEVARLDAPRSWQRPKTSTRAVLRSLSSAVDPFGYCCRITRW